MKFTIEIDPAINPDAVGEYLRSAFFDEDTQYAVGCYTTHEWQKDVEPLEDIVQEDSTCEGCQKMTPHKTQGGMNSMEYVCTCTNAETWTRGKKQVGVSELQNRFGFEIECRWHWDGDGTLVFLLPDGQYLVNTDCKKDHDWYLTEDPEDF